MLSWEYPPRIVGGISRVVYDLAQKLGEKDNEVHVVTFCEPGTKEVEKDKNVFVHRVPAFDVGTYNFVDWVLHLNFALIERSICVLNDVGSFDIIHAHDWIVAFAAKTLKNSYHIPLVCTIHATESGRNWGIHNDVQRYISGVEWWLAYESWRVIVNSNYMRNEVKSVFSLPDDKIRIIPNGVDINKFKGYERNPEFRLKYAMENERVVFFVGRLVNEKGANVLLEAIPKVLQQCYDTKFIIAGRGPQLDHLKWMASAMNISHKVLFTGYIGDEDLLKLYKCADIAVFPSLYEPFGIVALEGMVADVPVVVSDTGGLGEIVHHGVDGMKAYTGNANSLADCILELLFNADRAEEMKRRAMEKVKRVYNWDVISEQTMEVYKEIENDCKVNAWERKNIKEQLEGL